MIPITKVVVPEGARALVQEVLESGSLAQGVMVERFEHACAAMAGTEHAVAVSNGTVAIVAMLQAAGIGPGMEVITSPFTFAATLNAILEVGATAVFGDIDDDFNLDPASVDRALSERTAAVLAVHLYGQCARMEEIESVVAGRGVDLFEDAAQAHGAARLGRNAGGLGRAGTFSFYATKTLFAGEGGCVTTNDRELADELRVLRNQGMRARYEYLVPGYNWRLTDLAAALAIPQFADLPSLFERRNQNAEYFRARLEHLPQLSLPSVTTGNTHGWHQFTMAVRSAECAYTRDEVVERLNAAGVGAGVYYPRAVYDYACYREHPRVVISDTPRADAAGAHVFSIPVHQHLSDVEREQVAEAVVASVEGS